MGHNLFGKSALYISTALIFQLFAYGSAIAIQNSETNDFKNVNRVPASDWNWDTANRLFDPKNAPPPFSENGFGDWAQCMVGNDNNNPTKSNSSGELLPICQPDTLYTWGPYIKVLTFMRAAGPTKNSWNSPFIMPVFAHINPVATFGYGETPIRIKLKKDTQYVLGNENSPLDCSENKWRNSIQVKSWKYKGQTGVDYILCSPGPIESWSIGTKRHYDEIIASELWNLSAEAAHKSDKWISYVVRGGNNLLFNTGLDGHDWTVFTYLNYLKTFYNFAQKEPGLIVYAPKVSPSSADHFSSKNHTYWHQ